MQYGMQHRLHMLGWRQIEVIDEDLGCSAAGTVTRSGKLVTDAQVGLMYKSRRLKRVIFRFAIEIMPGQPPEIFI